MAFAIGFDIGGTKVECSLIDETGAIHNTLREPAPKDNPSMLALIERLTHEARAGHDIGGVGFSIPGSINPKTGLLRNAPNSPAIEGTALAADLKARLQMPLAFENDANCLAASEARFGAARGYKHVVGIILGTGVGGGVIIDGRLLNGAHGLAPEIGHTIIDYRGRLCGCGNRGCVEAYLSGPSVLARYHDAGGSKEVTNTKDMYARQDSDTIAADIIEETDLIFCRFIGSLISMYDPQVFVLGGGLSLQPRFYNLSERIAEFSFGTKEIPPIKKAEGGDSSGKLGAAALIFGAESQGLL